MRRQRALQFVGHNRDCAKTQTQLGKGAAQQHASGETMEKGGAGEVKTNVDVMLQTIVKGRLVQAMARLQNLKRQHFGLAGASRSGIVKAPTVNVTAFSW